MPPIPCHGLSDTCPVDGHPAFGYPAFDYPAETGARDEPGARPDALDWPYGRQKVLASTTRKQASTRLRMTPGLSCSADWPFVTPRVFEGARLAKARSVLGPIGPRSYHDLFLLWNHCERGGGVALRMRPRARPQPAIHLSQHHLPHSVNLRMIHKSSGTTPGPPAIRESEG